MTIKVRKLNDVLNSVQASDTFFLKFENAGNPNLAVNGSVTPVEFTLPLPAGSNFLLQAVSFVVGTTTILDPNNFGNAPSLANGVLFEMGGSPSINFVDNGDILLLSNTTSVESVAFGGTQSGILFGQWDLTESFGGNAMRVYDNALKITIRDNLSGVDYFRVSAHGVFFEEG